MIFVGETHILLKYDKNSHFLRKIFFQSNSLNSGSFLYNSGRPGDHAPFLETRGNSGRLGRSVLLIYYTLLKVVSHCDLSVLSMSVMDFQKKVWVGGVSSMQFCSYFLNFLTLQCS